MTNPRVKDLSPTGNPLLDRLGRGEPAALLGVRYARTPDVARYAKASGHHGLWVDMEHSGMPVDTAAAICAAAFDLGLTPLVRLPEREHGMIGRLLDSGAMGIIAPRIETAQQAADVVAACRFPPLGHRSATALLPQLGYQRVPAAQMYEQVNRMTIVQVLIESPLGVQNAQAIADVPGVDLVAVGTNDLCAELGAADFRDVRVRESHEQLLRACAQAGKPFILGGIPDAAYVADFVRRGAARVLMTGIDSDILLAALHERAQQAFASVLKAD